MYTISSTLQTALAAGTPQRVLLEFQSADTVFSNEDISISRGIELNEMFMSENDMTAGLCPSAEIRFDLLNDNGQLENFEFGTFKAWLGARIVSGTPASGAKTKTFTEGGVSCTYEFTPLGVFIAERPAVVMKKILNITANDQMQLFDVEMPLPEDMNLTYPTTLGTLYSRICTYAGVQYKSGVFMNSTLIIAEEPNEFYGATMRDVLGWIAEAACSVARFDRDGVLEMVWFSAVNKSYDEHNYSEFAYAWYETEAVDGLTIENANSEESTVLGTDPANAYLIRDNPFLRADDTVTGGG